MVKRIKEYTLLELQARHLKASGFVSRDVVTWNNLGDLYKKEQKFSDANVAYQQVLNLQ